MAIFERDDEHITKQVELDLACSFWNDDLALDLVDETTI